MRRTIRWRDRNLFLTLFLAGFVVGVFYITAFGKTAVQDTTLMSPYFFSKYKRLEFISEELFFYTLKSRISSFTLLWLMGLTVVGAAAVYICLFWLGAALGITATTAAMKLGVKGILLCIAGALPHAVLYVPAGFWLLKRICEMSGSREPRTRQWSNPRKLFCSYLLVWALGALLFLAGAFLESYVNPLFLKTLLKKM